ncbi:DUF3164 family protein [Sphingobacterium sp. UBA6308]|uniref:DUF3164 family protein n=1 Tax=Sphingobacterium TaxID=28453 RepID=UPI00257A4C2C|nr:DUF3164 family protein [Sphingobacterium sp. UBA6308]
METTTLNKPASELTLEELKALTAQREQSELSEKQKAREAYETLRDDSITSMVSYAIQLNESLKGFKKSSFEVIETLYKMLQEHSNRHAQGKGNVTLDTADGQFRVVFKRSDNTRFDERATQAEAHILDFLTSEYPEGSNTSKLIRSLLERKKGQLDKNLVLKLIGMKNDFDNEHWKMGIDLLQESIVPDETRFYAEYFYRSDDGEWLPIVLNFAKLTA